MGILGDLGRAFAQGFAEGMADTTNRRDRGPVIEARDSPRLPAVEVPPDFGTPVSDSFEGLGEELISSARSIRRYEPLPLKILKKHGMRTSRANAAAVEALGDLLKDFGEEPVPPDFGTSVSDSLEGLGEQLISSARLMRKHEPLSLEILKRHGARTSRANAAAVAAQGDLLNDL